MAALLSGRMNTLRARALLGIHNSDPNAARKAFKRKALEYHPDRQGGDVKKFQEMKLAMDYLCDPEVRAAQRLLIQKDSERIERVDRERRERIERAMRDHSRERAERALERERAERQERARAHAFERAERQERERLERERADRERADREYDERAERFERERELTAVRLRSQNVNRRTQMCRYVNTPSGCCMGDSCRFAHTEEELKKNIKRRDDSYGGKGYGGKGKGYGGKGKGYGGKGYGGKGSESETQ